MVFTNVLARVLEGPQERSSHI